MALDGALLQLTALTLGQTTPDAEALVIHQRRLEAICADITGEADLFRFTSRPTLLWEERLGVSLCAERTVLPTQLLGVCFEEKQFSHGTRPFDPVFSAEGRSLEKNTSGITCLSYPESQDRI